MAATPNYLPRWRPGIVHDVVMSVAQQLARHEVVAPPLSFFEALAGHAQNLADEAVAEAVDAGYDDDKTVAENIRIVRRLVQEVGNDVQLAIETADHIVLSRLAAYLVVDGHDGYQTLRYTIAWGAHRDPQSGTVWAIHEPIRDFVPAFLFKVCLRGEVRHLAVECHAPTRHLPDEGINRIKERTIMISGVPVLAFSPAEVEADPGACVAEIADALAVLVQELLALSDMSPPPRRDFRPRHHPD